MAVEGSLGGPQAAQVGGEGACGGLQAWGVNEGEGDTCHLSLDHLNLQGGSEGAEGQQPVST